MCMCALHDWLCVVMAAGSLCVCVLCVCVRILHLLSVHGGLANTLRMQRDERHYYVCMCTCMGYCFVRSVIEV